MKLHEPYRLGDPSASVVVVANTESFFGTSCPLLGVVSTDVDGWFSVEELTVVVPGFDKFLIVVCNSDRSCCKARLNLSSLSSFTSNCRFSFSKSLNLNKK
jgi:hypothetical protein